MTEQLNGAIQHSVQESLTNPALINYSPDSGVGVLPLLVKAGELIPPYWSRARDLSLSQFALKVDHVSSAFSMFISKTATIPLRVLPRDTSIKAHVKQADDLTANLNEMSDWGKGWVASFAPKMIFSFITQDNGMFAEIIGDGPADKQRRGFYGIRFLDPSLCQRTSNPEYPVIFWDIGIGGTGLRYKMHHTRVMLASSLPQVYTRLNGLGFCAMSRMINTAQHLLDISTMEQEELGSRPKRRMIVGEQGITAQEIVTAFQQADMQMDNQGLTRYSKSVVVASTTKPTSNNPIKLNVLDLYNALAGEDKERSITLGMFLIALALNIPPRWLWPASSSGATKADAMFQHLAGMGGGVGMLLSIFENMLGGTPMATALGKPVPSHLQVVFDNQDDEQDRMQAEIRKVRNEVWALALANSSVNDRVVRQQMLEAGDLSEQQFDDLELADGRLPDGTDILNLFMTTDPDIVEMLALSIGDVLNPEANDRETVLQAIADKELEVRAILANPVRPAIFDKAKQAFAALQALRTLYLQPTIQEQQEGLNAINEANQEVPQQIDEGEEAPVKQEAAKEEVVVKEKRDGSILDKAIAMIALNRKEPAPVINVTMPEIVMPDVNVTIQPPEINVTTPDIIMGDTHNHIPKQDAPKVEVKNVLPSQLPPAIHANINMPRPEKVKEAPPVINVNVPEQPAPVINVTPEITVNVPEVAEEITTVERDESGLIKLAKKLRVYK